MSHASGPPQAHGNPCLTPVQLSPPVHALFLPQAVALQACGFFDAQASHRGSAGSIPFHSSQSHQPLKAHQPAAGTAAALAPSWQQQHAGQTPQPGPQPRVIKRTLGSHLHRRSKPATTSGIPDPQPSTLKPPGPGQTAVCHDQHHQQQQQQEQQHPSAAAAAQGPNAQPAARGAHCTLSSQLHTAAPRVSGSQPPEPQPQSGEANHWRSSMHEPVPGAHDPVPFPQQHQSQPHPQQPLAHPVHWQNGRQNPWQNSRQSQPQPQADPSSAFDISFDFPLPAAAPAQPQPPSNSDAGAAALPHAVQTPAGGSPAPHTPASSSVHVPGHHAHQPHVLWSAASSLPQGRTCSRMRPDMGATLGPVGSSMPLQVLPLVQRMCMDAWPARCMLSGAADRGAAVRSHALLVQRSRAPAGS